MTANVLLAWVAIAVAGPIVGLLAGPSCRRTLRRRGVVIISVAAAMVVVAAWTPVSLPGVRPDHAAAAGAYVWGWTLVGMLRSRMARGMIFGLATIATAWLATRPEAFVLGIVWGDLTRLPQQTVSMACEWSTRTVRVRSYGWVASSGYEVAVSTRPWGMPVEVELGRRLFNDAEYPAGEQFAARLDGQRDCTTVVSYEGTEQWRVP